MATATLDKVQRDPLAISVANALAVANEAAQTQGVDLEQSLVTITEESTPTGLIWRISYGPRDFVNRRGGDLIVLVDDGAQAIRRIMRGQ